MTEQIQDQISAFIDDELSAEECAFFVRRLERDPGARSQLIRFSVIGSALRGELLQPEPTILRRRIQNELNGVSIPARNQAAPARRGQQALRPAVGVGIAASVAALALVTLKSVNEIDIGTTDAALADRAAESPAWSEPASYVVPQDPSGATRILSPPIRLTNYLMHHGEYASPMSRASVHSNVVGTGSVEAEALPVDLEAPE